MDSPRMVILDGYSLLFRAYYGSRPLSTSDGRPTNALFGFVNMLLALFSDKRSRPDILLVALDAPGKTFRHAEYAEYKGTRRETPEDLVSQLDFSRQLMADLNIQAIEMIGYEADDVIGSLSLQAKRQGIRTVIVSGDHDSLQLVDEDVNVLMPQNGPNPPKLYDIAAVEERYSLQPEQIKDYKALAGDSSDNIPGVPGIGDKSAVALLKEFGHVEAIRDRLDQVPEKFRKKIAPAVDSMMLSKRLATIEREAPVSCRFDHYRLDRAAYNRARQALLDLQFKSQVARLDNLLKDYMDGHEGGSEEAAPAEIRAEPIPVREVEVPASLAEWVGAAPYALHPVSAAPAQNLFEQEPQRWALARGGEACVILEEQAEALAALLPGQLVGHDLKPLYKSLPVQTAGPRMDVMLGAYVLQSGRSSYDLDGLATAYLGGAAAETALQKAAACLELDQVMRERLDREGQSRALDEAELPLIPVLAAMEKRGILLSVDMLREFSKSLESAIDQSKTLIWEMAGEQFNIGSPKQIGEVLFEKMGLPGSRKTKTGYATGEEILGEMAPTVPIAGEILNYRSLTKLKSTYADALPKLVEKDGRIRTSFNQTVAATGRLSSKDPNLQNIPIKDELGRLIRRAFHAREGETLLSLDYSQIELRVLADMCEDPALVEAFATREDVHTVTAALMFGIEQDAVTKDQRRLAKMLNYAVLYGVSGFGLANQLGQGFSASDANALIKQYNERFPKVKAFTDGIVEEARSKGFTATLIGRRRYFPDINTGNRVIRQGAERQAMNAPIQGTAADMIKLAMIDVHKRLGDGSVKMLLQVHDELVFEGPDSMGEEVEPIREIMENSLRLKVPVEVDSKRGPNWLDMTEVPAAGRP